MVYCCAPTFKAVIRYEMGDDLLKSKKLADVD